MSAARGLNPETRAPARETRYRLCDNYARFYLHYVEPHRERIEAGSFRPASLETLPGWDAVMGLQFENLVLNNVPTLLDALRLARANVLSAAPYRKRPDGNGPGVQIDLLVQTRRALYVVEIKRKREIGREIVDEVDRKLARIPRPDGVSLRPVLVYDGALAPSVLADGFFDAVLPASSLLLGRSA